MLAMSNYLVKADEQNSNGYWAIYQWTGTEWTRTKLQTFNTSKFWSYIDWYKSDGDMVRKLGLQLQSLVRVT